MALGLQSANVHLGEVFVECVLYGLYLVTFFACVQTLLYNGSGKTGWSRFTASWLMITFTLLLFIVSSLNLALVFLRLVQGIAHGIRSHNDQQYGTNWVNIVKDFTGYLQNFIADIVLIYRCWVMYAHSRTVILFPIFMWLGGTACMILSTWSSVKFNEFGTGLGGKRFAFDTGFWASTICLNLYATISIVLRIYNVEKATMKLHGDLISTMRKQPSRLQIAMCIINESAFMHTAATIFYFATLEIGSSSANITSAAQIQIVGITFNLILIRSAKHNDQHANAEFGQVSTTFRFDHGTVPDGEVHVQSFVARQGINSSRGKETMENSSSENVHNNKSNV